MAPQGMNVCASLFQCKHYFVCIPPSLVLKVRVINEMLLNTWFFSYFCQDALSAAKVFFSYCVGFMMFWCYASFFPLSLEVEFFFPCFLLFEPLFSEKKMNWSQPFLYFLWSACPAFTPPVSISLYHIHYLWNSCYFSLFP